MARQVPTSGRRRTVAKTDNRGWTPFRRPLRYRSQAMGKNAVTDCKKYTAYGLVRRGRPLTSQTAFGGQLPYKGSLVRPVARFHHSLFEHDGRLLRATCRVSGCTQDSRGLFGPSGADQRKAQDGCQNGQQRLDALFRTSPTKAPLGAFFLRAEGHSRRPATGGAVRPIHRIVDNVAISLYNINTYSYSMRLAEKGDFIDEF